MLQQAIIDGLKNSTRKAVSALLETTDPLDIINRNIIPALTTVGDQFESGESFLPQLVMSAEAASLAFEEIKKKLPAESSGEKGRVILATVEGDIHDIGKNIVKTLLESYGFDVLDLERTSPSRKSSKQPKKTISN